VLCGFLVVLRKEVHDVYSLLLVGVNLLLVGAFSRALVVIVGDEVAHLVVGRVHGICMGLELDFLNPRAAFIISSP
jgi:hypothetical protein